MLEARRKAARGTNAVPVSVAVAIVIVLVSIVGIGVQASRAKIQGDLTATNATAYGRRHRSARRRPRPWTSSRTSSARSASTLEQSVGSDGPSRGPTGSGELPHDVVPGLVLERQPVLLAGRQRGDMRVRRRASSRSSKFHNILYGKDSSAPNINPPRTQGPDRRAAGRVRANRRGSRPTQLTTFQRLRHRPAAQGAGRRPSPTTPASAAYRHADRSSSTARSSTATARRPGHGDRGCRSQGPHAGPGADAHAVAHGHRRPAPRRPRRRRRRRPRRLQRPRRRRPGRHDEGPASRWRGPALRRVRCLLVGGVLQRAAGGELDGVRGRDRDGLRRWPGCGPRERHGGRPRGRRSQAR